MLGYIFIRLQKHLHKGMADVVLVTAAMVVEVVLAVLVESVELKESEVSQFVFALLDHHQEYSR